MLDLGSGRRNVTMDVHTVTCCDHKDDNRDRDRRDAHRRTHQREETERPESGNERNAGQQQTAHKRVGDERLDDEHEYERNQTYPQEFAHRRRRRDVLEYGIAEEAHLLSGKRGQQSLGVLDRIGVGGGNEVQEQRLAVGREEELAEKRCLEQTRTQQVVRRVVRVVELMLDERLALEQEILEIGGADDRPSVHRDCDTSQGVDAGELGIVNRLADVYGAEDHPLCAEGRLDLAESPHVGVMLRHNRVEPGPELERSQRHERGERHERKWDEDVATEPIVDEARQR